MVDECKQSSCQKTRSKSRVNEGIVSNRCVGFQLCEARMVAFSRREEKKRTYMDDVTHEGEIRIRSHSTWRMYIRLESKELKKNEN